ncbi:MAG: hypothetical protein R2857_06215 [Vampirovibrionales bacterium]
MAIPAPMARHVSSRFGTAAGAAMGRAMGAALPWSVTIHTNQVLSRSFLDIFGYYPGILIVSRNLYERLEKALMPCCGSGWGFLPRWG